MHLRLCRCFDIANLCLIFGAPGPLWVEMESSVSEDWNVACHISTFPLLYGRKVKNRRGRCLLEFFGRGAVTGSDDATL